MWTLALKAHQSLRTIRRWDNPQQSTNTESITQREGEETVEVTQNNLSLVSEKSTPEKVLNDGEVTLKRQRGDDLCDTDSNIVVTTLSSLDTNSSVPVKQRCEGSVNKDDCITSQVVVSSEKHLNDEVFLIEDDDENDNDDNTTTSSTNKNNNDAILQKEGASQDHKGISAPPAIESEQINSSQTPIGSSGLGNAPFVPFNSLSEEQQHVFDLIVKHHRSVFLTGGAGTGKSHLLRAIVAALPRSTTFVTATTGLAALNLNGSTIHSFSGCGIIEPQQHSADDVYHIVQRKTKAKRNWRTCNVLVIDEISMMDAWFLDVLEYVARKIRGSREPFGGIQVVFSGDFLQLPPIVKNSKKEPRFCFEANAWCRINPRVCILSRCFRQKDDVFFGMLNEMRHGALTATSLVLLNSLSINTTVRFVKEEEEEEENTRGLTERKMKMENTGELTERKVKMENIGCESGKVATIVDSGGLSKRERYKGFTILRARRAEVEAVNMERFNELKTEIVTYNGFHRGEGKFPADLPLKVSLRVGCRVMLLKNIDVSLGLVNGSVGTLEKLIDTRHVKDFANKTAVADLRLLAGHTFLPVVRFETHSGVSGNNNSSRGRLVVIEPHRWTVLQGEREVSCSIQIPLQLAYAITIHKSQGMSLSHVNVDFKGIFEEGQAYVALSRCCDMSNLVIENFDAYRVNPNVKALAYYKALEDASSENKKGEAEKEEEEILKDGGNLYPWGTRDFHDMENEDYGNYDNECEGHKSTPEEIYWKKSAAAIVEDIRRRLTPTFVMLSAIRSRVLSATEQVTSIKGALLVMDTTSLIALTSSINSAALYEELFLKQQNMIRVPRVVKDELLRTVSLADLSDVRSTPTVRLSFSSARSNSPTSASHDQCAAEAAAATLCMMEDAKNEFVLDEQRDGESRPLPSILPQWGAFPLFSNTSTTLSTIGNSNNNNNNNNSGVASTSHSFCGWPNADGSLTQGVNGNSVMRQVQVLEFSCYLMEKYSSHCPVLVCTESIELAAHALSVGLRVCSLSYLSSSERA